MRPFELRGGGILLATPTVDDIDRITEICQDRQNQQWTSIPVPYERTHAEAFVTQTVPTGWASGQVLTWAIRDQEDRRILGMIDVRLDDGTAGELGFNLAPDARGQRIMSRAIRLVSEYAFAGDGLGLTHLHWWAYVGNWASRRVAWATGFRFAGLLRGARAQRGVSRDTWVATLAAGEPMRPATPWFDVSTIRGDDVMLRPFDESDAGSVVEACNDPLSQHWLTSLPAPYTHDHAIWFIHSRADEAATGRGVHWAVAPPEGGSAIGSISLMNLDAIPGGAEVGYWLHPAARGRGMATDALRLLSRYAVAPREQGGLGLHRLIVAYATGNDASRKVIERTGFRPSGVERAAHRTRGGDIVDLVWYDLLSDDLNAQTSTRMTP